MPDATTGPAAPRARRTGLLDRLVLAVLAGVLAGVSSFVFLEVLERVTEAQADHERLVLGLPFAGLALGLAARRAGRATQGNALVLAEVRRPAHRLPWTMAPFALIGAWVTHLFGGSAGREGIALQMSASLVDQLPRVRPLDDRDRRVLLATALAGGFGAVFGVPFAGTVFALEVPGIRGLRRRVALPALVAALVGDAVVHGLGHAHAARAALHPGLGPGALGRALVAGAVFGVAGAAFLALTHGVRHTLARVVRPTVLRPAVGGLVVLGLALVAGRASLGLSLPLLDQGLAGEQLAFSVFAWKLVFTAVTIGAGFPGGEVTPLFVIGTTLGAALATPLGAEVPVLAALGFVAVFAAAARAPLACGVLAVELFGRGIALPAVLACVVARAVAGAIGGHGVYADHDLPAQWLNGVRPVRRARRGGRGGVRRSPRRGS